MLTPEELNAWYQRLNIPEHTRKVIDNIRSSDPSRLVGGGKGNVSGRYPSEKMGVTIQFDSHTVELAGVYEYEYDPDVLEYYDQAPRLKLKYSGLHGRPVTAFHSDDFFIIRQSGAGWEEWKTEDELKALADRNPNRYCMDQIGTWTCPPGIEHAKRLGLYYRVRSSSEINEKYKRNIIFLEDYLREGAPPISSDNRDYLRKLAEGLLGIELLEFMHIAENKCSRDVVFGAIATSVIYVDLTAAALVEPLTVRVYPSKDFAVAHSQSIPPKSKLFSLRSGGQVVWDAQNWTVANVGESTISLLSADQRLFDLSTAAFETLIREQKVTILSCNDGIDIPEQGLSRLMKASRKDLDLAVKRLHIVNEYLRSPSEYVGGTPIRTVQRWAAEFRQAEAGNGIGFEALLSRESERGNRTPKLPPNTLAKMREHIGGDYESKNSPNMYSSWVKLIEICHASGIEAPGYKTFCQACNKRPVYEQTRKRRGARAAYKFEPVYWCLSRDTPRHGDRPFEAAHIDHTEMDVELVSEKSGENFKRPWLTLMIDAFSRRILGTWISFDPPSYRSCMMVIRDCVKRHNRLPQFVIVDNGAEFRSIYFEALLAAHKCTKKQRPKAKSRFGGVIERLFGTTNTQFIHNLRGNTKLTREVRIVTKSVNPKHLAIWTLRELTARLNQYLFDVYDQLEHPALGESPRDCFMRGMEVSGQRLHKMIPYDKRFIFTTLPTTHKGTATLSPGKGVKIHYIHYWSNFFNDPEIEGRRIPIRYDPFDYGRAYAFVRNQWVDCKSEYYSAFAGHSEREIMLATEELRRKNHQQSGKRFDVNAKRLAQFLTSVDVSESILEQRAMDREMQISIHGTPAADAVPPQSVSIDGKKQADSSNKSSSITDDEIEEYDEF